MNIKEATFFKEFLRVAEDGYDRTPSNQFVAEGGADRLAERNQRAS
mgnify:CR=1 FL=1